MSNNFVRLNLKGKWKGKVRRTRKGLEARRPGEKDTSSFLASERRASHKHRWGATEDKPAKSFGAGGGRGKPSSGGNDNTSGVSSSGTDALHTCLSILHGEESETSKAAVGDDGKKIVISERNRYTKAAKAYVACGSSKCMSLGSVLVNDVNQLTPTCDVLSVVADPKRTYRCVEGISCLVNCFESRNATPGILAACFTHVRNHRYCSRLSVPLFSAQLHLLPTCTPSDNQHSPFCAGSEMRRFLLGR